jgi:hypothetical protein
MSETDPLIPVRVITQITVSSTAGSAPDRLYALCNDGTVWRLVITHPLPMGAPWEQMPGILSVAPAKETGTP